jgi:hypothetical protein
MLMFFMPNAVIVAPCECHALIPRQGWRVCMRGGHDIIRLNLESPFVPMFISCLPNGYMAIIGMVVGDAPFILLPPLKFLHKLGAPPPILTPMPV